MAPCFVVKKRPRNMAPAKGAEGKWSTTSIEGGLEARFESADGKLLGFALMGTATAQRGSLTKELPAILA